MGIPMKELFSLGRHAFHDEARTNLRKTQTKTIFAAKNTAQNHFCCEKQDQDQDHVFTLNVIFAGWNAHNFSFPSP
jgi:hypothetical protein